MLNIWSTVHIRQVLKQVYLKLNFQFLTFIFEFLIKYVIDNNYVIIFLTTESVEKLQNRQNNYYLHLSGFFLNS